jgi:hypothetical protein
MPKKEYKKNVWLAVLLAILLPGAGHDYNRKDKLALLFFIVVLVCSLFYYTSYWFVGIIGTLIWIYSIYDAYRLTKHTIKQKPRMAIVWFVILLYIFILGTYFLIPSL